MGIFSSQNYIYQRKKALTSKECEELLELFETASNLHEVGKVGIEGRLDPKQKKCTEVLFDVRSLTQGHFKPVSKALYDACESYKKQYPSLDKTQRWTIAPTFKMQRYFPTEGYFTLHSENEGGSDQNKMMAWMIYLNDVTDGGYTKFPAQKVKFQPRRGTVLLWPAYWTHPHQGITSHSQSKYILTGWYRYE